MNWKLSKIKEMPEELEIRFQDPQDEVIFNGLIGMAKDKQKEIDELVNKLNRIQIKDPELKARIQKLNQEVKKNRI